MGTFDRIKHANDEERLLFVAELFFLNASSLLEDLSSAKYTLLSFSDKSRNEVRRKNTLIHSVCVALRALLELRDCLHQRQQVLHELERKLVQPSRPVFITAKGEVSSSNDNAADILSTQEQNNNNDKDDDNNELLIDKWSEFPSENKRRVSSSLIVPVRERGGEARNQHNHIGIDCSDATLYTVALAHEDMVRVQKADLLLEERREELARLAKERNQLEDQLDANCARHKEMMERLQNLRIKSEEVHVTLEVIKKDRQLYNMFRSEFEERKRIFNEAVLEMRNVFVLCRREELTMMQDELERVQVCIASFQKEVEKKKHSNELELAVYQIAYKEQQAAAEELKDAISNLHVHQRKLEILAKQQEIEEARRNCIRRLVMATFGISPDAGKPSVQELSSEDLIEVQNDHRQVSLLATRVGIMEERRKAIVALLHRENPFGDDTRSTRFLLEKVRDLLLEEIIVDEKTLQNEENQ